MTSISLVTDTPSYEVIESCIEETMHSIVKDIKIKKKRQNLQVLHEHLQDASLELDKSIHDRQKLLVKYLQLKYKEDARRYIHLLHELNILTISTESI